MRAVLVAALLALAGCQLDEPTIGGTVVSVLETSLESLEPSAKHYEHPLVPEVAWQVEVRLDDGAAVTVLQNGPRRYAPGERVRVLRDEGRRALLL